MSLPINPPQERLRRHSARAEFDIDRIWGISNNRSHERLSWFFHLFGVDRITQESGPRRSQRFCFADNEILRSHHTGEGFASSSGRLGPMSPGSGVSTLFRAAVAGTEQSCGSDPITPMKSD